MSTPDGFVAQDPEDLIFWQDMFPLADRLSTDRDEGHPAELKMEPLVSEKHPLPSHTKNEDKISSVDLHAKHSNSEFAKVKETEHDTKLEILMNLFKVFQILYLNCVFFAELPGFIEAFFDIFYNMDENGKVIYDIAGKTYTFDWQIVFFAQIIVFFTGISMILLGGALMDTTKRKFLQYIFPMFISIAVSAWNLGSMTAFWGVLPSKSYLYCVQNTSPAWKQTFIWFFVNLLMFTGGTFNIYMSVDTIIDWILKTHLEHAGTSIEDAASNGPHSAKVAKTSLESTSETSTITA